MTIPAPVKVKVPASRVVHWGAKITIIEEVYDWLLTSVGWGDKGYWGGSELLDFHIQQCRGRTRCGIATYPCRSEDWGWTLDEGAFSRNTTRTVVFVFRNSNHAMLFKLAWGGN